MAIPWDRGTSRPQQRRGAASVPEEQDRAEALDDDKGAFPADVSSVIDPLDQTADADPSVADIGRAVIDDAETGSDIDGVAGDSDNAPDPFHTEAAPPEVAAVHLT